MFIFEWWWGCNCDQALKTLAWNLNGLCPTIWTKKNNYCFKHCFTCWNTIDKLHPSKYLHQQRNYKTKSSHSWKNLIKECMASNIGGIQVSSSNIEMLGMECKLTQPMAKWRCINMPLNHQWTISLDDPPGWRKHSNPTSFNIAKDLGSFVIHQFHKALQI